MPPLIRVRALALLGAAGFAAAAPVAHANLLDDLPAGTGYAAWELCTRSQVSGEDFERVKRDFVVPKVQPLPKLWEVSRQPGPSVTVRSVVPFLNDARTAVFRPGLGCTLVTPGVDEQAVRAQPFKPVALPPPSSAPWPLGEAAAEMDSLTPAERKLLGGWAEQAFAEVPATGEKPPRRQNTLAFLVARDGHLVFERYATGHDRSQPQLGWSMTKTLTALIAGVMAADGKVQLDHGVGLARWAGTPKAQITWRQLLNMAPGLQWFEGYEGASDATEMLFSQGDQGAWAADRPLVSRPGAVFNYSTGFTNIAMLALRERAGGTHQAIYDYYQHRLFAPLGIRGGVIEPDASGLPVGGARGVLRPVDWLRLGQLVAQQGQWNGRQLIPADYMSFMAAPSPASSAYGGFIWRQETERIPAAVPRLPADLVWFSGHMGQYIVVVPSRRLVVLRMGVSFDEDETRRRVFGAVAALLAGEPAPPMTARRAEGQRP